VASAADVVEVGLSEGAIGAVIARRERLKFCIGSTECFGEKRDYQLLLGSEMAEAAAFADPGDGGHSFEGQAGHTFEPYDLTRSLQDRRSGAGCLGLLRASLV
jgi:hypothetical protein